MVLILSERSLKPRSLGFALGGVNPPSRLGRNVLLQLIVASTCDHNTSLMPPLIGNFADVVNAR